jgi:hypothetical protein
MNWFQKINGNIKYYKTIKDFPEDTVGFVYCITNLKNGKIYIGKKQLKTTKNVKLGKKELSEYKGVGRKPTKKTVISESDWSSYWSSSKPLKEDVQKTGKEEFLREILHLCKSKRSLTYWEVYYQFKHDVLQNDNSYNDSILGKFYKGNLE